MLLLALLACVSPSDLVPPTVVEDPSLPSLAIEVDGHRRQVHLLEYGDPSLPPLFVLPGSSVDVRTYRMLSELSDTHWVVMWDLRGNGLSERVPADELDPEDMVDEIEAVRQALAPDRRIRLLGHSWSGVFAAMYLGRYGEHVERAVLLEPNGFSAAIQEEVGLALNLMQPGYLDMAWANDGLSPDDHATLDYYLLGMLNSGVRDFFCDPDDRPDFPVWRPGGLALAVWEASILDGASLSFDFTPGMEDYEGPVLFVGTECSPIGTEFQESGNAKVFSGSEVVHIEDSGHRILTEKPDELIALLRDFLEAP